MKTENLSNLKINKLSKEQFKREQAAGNINETAIYLTPDDFVEDAEHPGCYYRMVEGEKEWINPPMIAGEEYRTTERWNGKPVYRKLITWQPTEAERAQTIIYVPHGISNFVDCVDLVTRVGPQLFVPYGKSSVYIDTVTAESIFINTNAEFNEATKGSKWSFNLACTKTTE